MSKRSGEQKPKVSVIVPNYNGELFLCSCLKSLSEQDVRQFEVIVVDDGSTDGSTDRARARFPESEDFPRIRYIEHNENLGFAQAVRDGIEAAGAPYVLLLNNDTVADKGFVRQLWYAIRKRKDAFSVSAKMIKMSDPELLDDSGDDYCALGWAYTLGKDRPAADYDRAREIFASCGGAAIYRRDVLERIGGFDELHFAYLEDIDVGYRAKLNGYRNYYCPDAVVEHAGSGSSGSRYNTFKVRLSPRNNVYLIYKNMPDLQILVNLPLLAAGFLIKYLFFVKLGYGREYRESIAEGFRLCREHPEKRVDFSKIPKERFLRIEKELLANTIRRFSGKI